MTIEQVRLAMKSEDPRHYISMEDELSIEFGNKRAEDARLHNAILRKNIEILEYKIAALRKKDGE